MDIFIYTFFPALAISILIRVDAKIIGPYFSMTSILPGFAGAVSADFSQRPTLRWALVRRLAYPVLMGAMLYIFRTSLAEAVIAGILGGFLLAWPAWIAPDDSSVVTIRDPIYHIFYVGVVFSGGVLAATGYALAHSVVVMSGGDVLKFFTENLFIFILSVLLTTLVPAFTIGVGRSMLEKGVERTRRYALDADEGSDTGV